MTTPKPSPLQQAYFVIRDLESKVAALTSEPIAIIGLACRFPGGSDTPEAFWDLLEKGRDAVIDLPPGRWDMDAYYDADMDAPGKLYARKGGYLGAVDGFDARFFGISPREANRMDPQQRLLLEVSWEALERAGVAPSRLTETRTGVFVGIAPPDYAQLSFHGGDPARVESYDGTGNAGCFAPGRLSYVLGLQGPSLMVDTACSSSLVAVHLACRSLRAGECDVALAAGVQLILTPETALFLSRAHALAPDGHCKPFDASANGYGRGEGCGVVVLKRLSAAKADGDPILAVIRGSAVNHGGPSSGLTVPNGRAQQALLRTALENAGVSPLDVGYVEAHGTGTSLGDPIEAEALAKVYGAGRSREQALWIGSVKSNMGHLESAAGIAGLIKAVLALEHRAIPPSLHFTQPNPHIPWDEFPLRVPTEKLAWEPLSKRRFAGVSSFGLNGTNAHVILEEAPAAETAPMAARASPLVLPLSARTAPALEALAAAWRDTLQSPGFDAPMEAIAQTAALRRDHHAHRLAIVGDTPAEWISGLDAFARGAAHPGVSVGQAAPGAPAKVVFVFPGQGSQWIGMGRELLAQEPVFRDALQACAEAFRPYVRFSLLDVLQTNPPVPELERIDVIQPVLFAMEVALAKLWRSWGVEPAAVVGHSMGEVAASHIAGALSLDDAARVICERSKLMLRVRGSGAMAVVELPANEVEPALAEHQGRVSVAASNSPRSTVLSGDTAAIDALVKRFEAEGIFARKVKVDVASHSAQVEPLLEELRQVLAGLRPTAGSIPLFSTVTRELTDGAGFDADYWARNLRQPVHFAHAIESLLRSGHTLFVEISPHPILLASIEQTVKSDASARGLASLRREQPERSTLLASLAALYANGCAVDWRKLYPTPAPLVRLPTYAWQRERFWVETQSRSGTGVDVDTSAARPLAGDRLLTPGDEIHFLRRVGVSEQPYLDDHRVFGRIVVPGAFHVATVLSVADELVGPGGCVLEAVGFTQALALEEKESLPVYLTATPADGGKMRFRRASLPPQQGRNGKWRDHATGIIAPLGEARAKDAPVRPGKELTSANVSEVRPADFYASAAGRGIELGPSFKWIRTLWAGEREAIALLEPPASLPGPKLAVHPARIDAILQTFAAAVPDSSNATFVPFGLDRFVFHGAPEGAWWCHARCWPSEGGDLWTGDVALYAEDGRAIGLIEGVRLKRATRELFLPGEKPAWTSWLFRQRWERHDLPAAAARPTTHGRWLLFVDAQGAAAALADKLAAAGETCVTAVPGASFEQRGGTEYAVSPERPEDFIRLLSAAQEAGPLRGIAYFWGMDFSPSRDNGAALLEQVVSRGCGGLLHLVQALASASFRDPPRVVVVTRGAQRDGEGGPPVSPGQAVLWGMARSLAFEQSAFGFTRIDLDPTPGAPVAEALARELLSPDGEEEVLLHGASRRAGRFSRLAELGPEKEATPIRGDASYIITGGLGGLGLSVARWLAERGARHLVLLGRGGAKTPEQQQAIEALKGLGADVVTAQADVADAAQLARVLDEANQRAPVRGIIHAAGLLDDGLAAQQTVERFRRVMAPKIAGAWNLHTLTRELDFFVLYSSAASLVGSPGQSNYASANAFLDALAHHRRAQGLPALSINWGAFTEVGLAAAQENRGARLANRGFQGIAPAEGLEVLARLLQTDLAQVGVTPLDPRQWLEFYPQLASSRRFSESVREAQRARSTRTDGAKLDALRAAAPADRQALIEEMVREQIARILRTKDGAVDRRTPFKALGFDSLMGLELRNRLEGTFGLTLSATLAWTYPNLDSLSQHLADKLGLSLSGPAAKEEPEAAAPETSSTNLDNMTEAQKESLLEERLASLLKRL